jgi:curved DNA-binding protein CbpA
VAPRQLRARARGDAARRRAAVRADLIALIQEGIAKHWSADRVLADLAPHMNESVAGNRRLASLAERLRADETAGFLDALDGSRTLWNALQHARSPRGLATAWLVDALRAVDYRAPEEAKEEGPEVEPELEIVLTEIAREPGASRAARPDAPASPHAGMNEVLVLEVSQKYVALDELDYYALLGIERDAAPVAVKRAYLDAAKRFHPDALARAGLDKETREKAGRVFAAIGKAHAVLADAKRRRSYDASLDSDETDLDAERLAAAETNYRKGEILARQGNFRGAIEFLRPAVELWPEDATYQGAYGWALFKAAPSDPVPCARAPRARDRARAAQRRGSRIGSRSCSRRSARWPGGQPARSARASSTRVSATARRATRAASARPRNHARRRVRQRAPSSSTRGRTPDPSAPRRRDPHAHERARGALACRAARSHRSHGVRPAAAAPLDHGARLQRVERLHRGLLERLRLLVVELLADRSHRLRLADHRALAAHRVPWRPSAWPSSCTRCRAARWRRARSDAPSDRARRASVDLRATMRARSGSPSNGGVTSQSAAV